MCSRADDGDDDDGRWAVTVSRRQPMQTALHVSHTGIFYYTVNHKKRASLFLIITLAFLGRFLYFLLRWKQKGILYKQVNKIYHFTLTVFPHYLVKQNHV